jgi:hypothetical protein
MSEKEMIITTAIILYTGISFVSGSIIGILIGNQITRRSLQNQHAEEFEYWIGSFEDEEGSDLDITATTPFETINTGHRGFPTA